MDRRGFLALIPTAALTSKVMAADYHRQSTGPIYKGYRIWKWTGWKAAQNNVALAGQWVAAPVNSNGEYYPYKDLPVSRPLLAVSVPGCAQPYRLGDTLDIRPRRGQAMVDDRTPERVKECERRKGLRRMFRLIDETVGL